MTSVLLRGARVIPGAPLQDVLVSAGRVVEIGDALHLRGETEMFNVDGRTVLPGLWDRHVHFDQWAKVSARIDLSHVTSAADAALLVAEHLARIGGDRGTPIVGYGFRDALWPDVPHRDALDRPGGISPVVLISADLHSAWLNGAALRRFGQRDHRTGLLREEAAMRVISEVDTVADEVSDAWVAAAVRAAAARGVVGVVDMERPWSLQAWRRRVAGGDRRLRVVGSVWPERLDDAVATGLRTGDVVDETMGLVSMGPLKIITDGSLNSRTALCHDAYPAHDGAQEDFGLQLVHPDELVSLMQRARAAGLACAIHAIGDRANTLALDAFARTRAAGSIEHAQLLDEADVDRFAQLEVTASVQPEHVLDDRDVADRYWPGRTRRAFVLRTLLDAGTMLTFGSDAPVAPLDPWLAIGAAVHRSRDGRPRWHPEQELTVGEALLASMPPGRSSPTLRVGDPADLIVVDNDPYTVAPEGLRTMPVAATMLGGRWTHRRDA